MKIIYYIAGAITNNPNYAVEFSHAEAVLQMVNRDAVILNPTILPEGLEHAQYMVMCRSMLEVATHVFVLNNGWEDSKGAQEELGLAKKGNKVIEFQ